MGLQLFHLATMHKLSETLANRIQVSSMASLMRETCPVKEWLFNPNFVSALCKSGGFSNATWRRSEIQDVKEKHISNGVWINRIGSNYCKNHN
jgi:hypothetical protein